MFIVSFCDPPNSKEYDMTQCRKFFTLLFVLFAACLAGWPQMALAQEPDPVKPDIPWVAPEGEVQSATVGLPDAQDTFVLMPYANTQLGLTYAGGRQFYGTTASGLFLWVGNDVYGPRVPAGPYHNEYTPRAFLQSGTGTVVDPYSIVTSVAAGDTGIILTSKITYVNYNPTIDFVTTVINTSTVTQAISLFHAGDLYLEFPNNQGDYGYGTRRAVLNGIGGTTSTGDWAFLFEPGLTLPSAYQEARYDTIWQAIGGTTKGSGFDDTFRTDYHDAGAGLQWDFSLAPGASKVIYHRLRLEDVDLRALSPLIDGFSFRNWGKPTHLTRRDFVNYFRAGGTCPEGDGECNLDRPAETWYKDNFDKAGDGGHCYGMSVASAMFYRSILDPQAYGPSALFAHDILSTSVAISREISILHTLQTDYRIDKQLDDAKESLTPNQVLQQIRAAIQINNLDPLIVGIYGRKKANNINWIWRWRSAPLGHALVPYAVEEKDDGKVWIKVYDSNAPGRMDRYIEFDESANRWQYEIGTGYEPVSGVEGDGVWAGDADHHAITIIPMSAHTGSRPNLPYKENSGFFYFGGNKLWQTNPLIIGAGGERLGYFDGTLVNEISDAIPVLPINALDEPAAPNFWVPTQDLTVTLDSNVIQNTDGSLLLMGDGFSLHVTDVDLAPNQSQTFALEEGGASVQMGAPSVQAAAAGATPTYDVVQIEYAFDAAEAGDPSKSVTLTGLQASSGNPATVQLLRDSNQVVVESTGNGASIYHLAITTVDGLETSSFNYNNLALAPGTGHTIEFAPDAGDTTVRLVTYSLNDLTILGERILDNGGADIAPAIYLPMVKR
jgi:hypothetical protein